MSESEKDTSGIRVFVYGTLKAGHCNNPALETAEFLGRCYLEGDYRIIDLGWYPAVIPAGDGRQAKIVGEVYRIDEDTLNTLDMIEGHPSYYTRKKVQTPWKNAWCYFLPAEYGEKDLKDCENGIWEANEDELEFIRGSENTA